MSRVDEIRIEQQVRDTRLRALWPLPITPRQIAASLGMSPRSAQSRARQLGLTYRAQDAKP